MTYRGEDIKRLIPQRNPFIMVDEIEATDDMHASAALTVRTDNYFMLADGTFAETGLIEHMAQSCAALMGCKGVEAGKQPSVGLIGEVKHFDCRRRPATAEKVCTAIAFGFSMGNVTLATAESRVGDELIAKAQLKIFIQ